VISPGLGTAFGARLGITTVEDGVEIEVVGVLECSGLFEAPMSPLFHGPTPSGDDDRPNSVARGKVVEMSPPWWQQASIYQIYPRSFLDTDGDGVGDLAGIRRQLDHIEWLGVDALWLSPVFPSPMADFGYDVADYCGIDAVFGDLDQFDRLVAEAHSRNLRILLDWVPNHSSSEHRWFVDSRSSRSAAHRDWYVWRDPAPGQGPPESRPPNNWIRAWSDQPAWTYDPLTEQFYLHLFLPDQPDLNWAHPPLVQAMHDTLRFWLDRGVDGFRMDVIHCIGKDPALADDPVELAGLSHVPLNDRPETHQLLHGIRSVLDAHPTEAVSVGEVYLLDTAAVASYLADDQLHLAFNFRPLLTRWNAHRWRRQVEVAQAEHRPDQWPTWVLSNHDNPRHATRYGSEARARAAAVLLLTLRGTPFLYAGEELGLTDAEVPDDRLVDPGGRDGCRAPIPWDGSPTHGWPTVDPWLPWPPDADTHNLATQRGDPSSMVHLYRRLLGARRASAALRDGSLELLAGYADDGPHGDVLAYLRRSGEDRRCVLVSFADDDRDELDVGPGWVVEVSSAGAGDRAGTAWNGELSPNEAVVLRGADGNGPPAPAPRRP
jgi:alpha-glucosidase